jgi:hypothetical protein
MRKKIKQRAPDLSVYDGSDHVGDIVERADGFDAFTTTGKLIGTYRNAGEAARAIPKEAVNEKHRAEEKRVRRAGRGRT